MSEQPSRKLFLKSRRPEQFSDSVKIKEETLDRTTLEYHLSTLNKRSQELQFEVFAKSLLEKEVCPNLLAQTGPTAGGDGKTDTQTYPVSEQVAYLWGINESAHSERWAFAVSTQKTWQKKCKGDVEKIVNTGRGYSKIFCITSEFVKASSRAELEDALSNKYSVQVVIFDRSWLLDKTLKPANQHLAIEHLGLTANIESEVQIGPYDAEKIIKLKEVDQEIQGIKDPGKLTYHEIDLFLQRAILSKELESDIDKTKGYFEIAVRTAKRGRSTTQHFEALYQYAWAANWWFEDIGLFEELFEQAINVIEDSSNANHWDKIVTLYTVQYTNANQNINLCTLSLDALSIKIEDKLRVICLSLELPSNVLQAKTSLESMHLLKAQNEQEFATIFESLEDIANESESLLGYPFERLYNFVSALDVRFGEMESYEKLLDHLTELSVRRNGDIDLSKRDLRRGAVNLDRGDYYKSIRYIGKALTGLYKNESRKDIFASFLMISCAYEKTGLLWAARGAALMAAHVATTDLWSKSEININQVIAYRRLMWIEAELGRLSQALAWYELAALMAQALPYAAFSENERISFDCLLGKLFLNANFLQASSVSWLPDELEHLGLLHCGNALLVSLGHEDLFVSEEEPDVDTEFMRIWRDYDFGSNIKPLNLYNDKWTTTTSVILGCTVEISFPTKTPCIEIAEGIAATLESFCATLIDDGAMSIAPKVEIDISLDDDDDLLIDHAYDPSAQTTTFRVLCSRFDPGKIDRLQQKNISQWMTRLTVEFFAALALHTNKRLIEKLIIDDKALDRAITYNSIFSLCNDLLGKHVKNIDYWRKDALTNYPPRRDKTWYEHYGIPAPEAHEGKRENQNSGRDLRKVKHTDIATSSLIQPVLWDQAKWSGVGFDTTPGTLPTLIIAFQQQKTGEIIFKNLEAEVGRFDSNNKLRIVIIKGISKDNLNHYRVAITSNIHEANPSRIIGCMARINTMTPNTSVNLDNFLNAYAHNKKYVITSLSDHGRTGKFHIIKDEIIVKYAWQITAHDPDLMGLRKGDDPWIPDAVESAPVIAALSTLRQFSGVNDE